VTAYVGVDGCSGGWFAVGVDPDGTLDHGRHPDLQAVFDAHGDAERLLIDVPIGLPRADRRDCDVAARARLGSRASTVFHAPCRAVLDAPDHETASAVNRERTGYGLSIQAWHLVPKIRAVDETLRSSPAWRQRVQEAHPELCFAALCGGEDGDPVAASKSTRTGRKRRLDRLRPVLPGVDDLYRDCLDAYRRADVARDDVLDAAVLALSATGPLARVPDVPDGEVPRDDCDLPMRIRFPAPGAFDE
jgi:predicted RNase H-like nuclease